ncbi:MAG: phage tail protein, partial [Pseudonocardiaceae bacterium]
LPMATRMAEGFERVTGRLSRWLDAMVESGKATVWFNRAWDTTLATGRVLADFLVGLYHIFRIGGQVAREEFGSGLADAAARFREWTSSEEGARRILRYFRDAVPAIRETVKILGMLAAGIAHLAANEDVAPLLAQIRTELLPALGGLIDHITQAGGLGPGLIDMFTAIATALTMIPLDGLLWIIQGITGLAWAIAWLVTEVPGLGTVLGFVLSLAIAGGMLGKIAGLFFLLGRGLMFFAGPLGWIAKLIFPTLRSMSLLGFLLGPVSRVATVAGTALRFLGGALLFVGRALLGLMLANPITAAILIVVGILLLLWFRFDWFRNAVMGALRAIGDFFVWIWGGIDGPVMAVLNAIWSVVEFVFGIIVGIVQIAVFVIVGILIGLLTLGKMIFEGLGFAAKLAWEYVIKPVWDAIYWGFRLAVDLIVSAWNWFVGLLSAGAHAVYNAVIAPLMGYWMLLYGFLRDYIFGPIATAGSWVWDRISGAARRVADVIGGIFGGIMNVVRGVYNFIAGGWNAIPGYTVPDWIPGIGGRHFGLPKLPLLAEGGVIEYSTALVGEQGPEALVKGGRFLGMLGAHGPELVTGLPPGGYVVPNLDTLNRIPGLTKAIPAGVADAVSAALPHYRPTLGREGGAPASDVTVQVHTGSEDVVDAVNRLTEAILRRRGGGGEDGGDPVADLRRALDDHDRKRDRGRRYHYASPRS